VRFAGKAQEAGVDVTLEVWDEMFHVFQMVAPLREAREAMAHIAAFASRTRTAQPAHLANAHTPSNA
jgi:acetyl esterase/lipase